MACTQCGLLLAKSAGADPPAMQYMRRAAGWRACAYCADKLTVGGVGCTACATGDRGAAGCVAHACCAAHVCQAIQGTVRHTGEASLRRLRSMLRHAGVPRGAPWVVDRQTLSTTERRPWAVRVDGRLGWCACAGEGKSLRKPCLDPGSDCAQQWLTA